MFDKETTMSRQFHSQKAILANIVRGRIEYELIYSLRGANALLYTELLKQKLQTTNYKII